MKTSEKEIKLLLVLLVIILAYAFYSFLLKPQIQLASELKANVAEEDMLVRNMYVSTLSYAETAEEVRETNDKILKRIFKFYTSEEQEVFLKQIEKWLSETGMTYTSITSQEPARYILSYVSEDEIAITEEANREPDAPADSMPVRWSSISIEADGKYYSAMRFLSAMANFKKDTIAYEMNIEAESESLAKKSLNPDVKMKISLYFLNLTGSSRYKIPEMPSDFLMPADFVSGAYRETFSFAGITAGITEALFGLVSKFIE